MGTKRQIIKAIKNPGNPLKERVTGDERKRITDNVK